MANDPCENAQKKTGAPGDLAARLFAGESYTALGKAYGVLRQTVTRWAESPDVIAEVEAMRAEVKSRVVNRYAKLAIVALDVHEEIMLDVDQPGAVRLAAAKGIQDRFLPVKQEVELSGGVRVSDATDADLDARARALAAAVLAEVEKPPRVGDEGDG